MTKEPLPTYPWFDQVPDNMKTRKQLAELGLRPGGPVVAQVVWRRGDRWADLYDLSAAKPKRAMTEAQRAALEKAREAQRLCYGCGKDTGMVIWRGFRPERDCPYCYEDYRQALAEEHAGDARAAARLAGIWLHSPRTVILDTETTDLDGYLVQLAIIRATDGQVLLDTFVNPQAPISVGARAVHRITDAQLADAPTFAQIEPELAAVLRGKRIVTYNAAFDHSILQNELHRLYDPPPSPMPAEYEQRMAWSDAHRAASKRVKAWLRQRRWRCAMDLYAQWFGDWSDYHGDYRWQPLVGGDHSALGDARACLEVLAGMAQWSGAQDERKKEEPST